MPQNPSIISGLVVDARGKPISNARVFFTASPVQLPDIAALTDKHGTFTLSVPETGDYTIQCVADGFSPKTVMTKVWRGQKAQLEIELSHQIF